MGFCLYPEYNLALPIEDASQLITTFLHQQKWEITGQQTDHEHVVLHAHRPRHSVASLSLQRVELHLRHQGSSTTLQYHPHLATHTRIALHLALTVLTVLCLFTLAGDLPPSIFPFAGGSYFALLVLFDNNRTGQKFINALCGQTYNTTGRAARHTKAGLFQEPSAPLFYVQHAIFLLMGLFFMLRDKDCATSMNYFSLTLLAFFIYLLALIPQTARQPRTSGELPNIIAAAAVFMYCLWPEFRAIQQQAFSHHATQVDPMAAIISAIATPANERQLQELLTMTWLGLGIAFMTVLLLLAVQVVPTMATAKYQYGIENEPTAQCGRPNKILITAGLAVWLFCIYAQARALAWVVQNTILSKTTPYLADTIWTTLLLGAYAFILGKAFHTALSGARRSTNAPTALVTRCQGLSKALRTRTPTVVLTNEDMSSAQRTLLNGHVLRLSATQLEYLDSDEADALILHEIAHLKKHAIVLGTLELLSAATLCGRGILSNLTDTRAMEFEADSAAAQALNALGKHGIEVVQRMLIKIEARPTIAALIQPPPANIGSPTERDGFRQRLQLLVNLVFGDGVLWYQHPTVDERIHALEQANRCHA